MIEELLEQQELLVEISGMYKSFGKEKVLRDINLSIPVGQTICILGESGCGKSVLMKTIIGLETPNAGRVLFDNEDVNRLSEKELSRMRLRFGYVFQNAALFDSMTVESNVAFPLVQHGRFKRNQIFEMVHSRLSEVGLSKADFRKKPSQLSGGTQKRVGLARALIMNPEIIMYDEPTTGLDPIMSDVINELIIRTRRRNPVTSIVVTHDMHTAQKVADRIIMMMPLKLLDEHEPQIIFDGTPEELKNCRDRRVQQFVNGEAGERLMQLRATTN